uniref:SET domain-containing protein n=1 Tax=Aplanochytrium stocchinoi TaxID=215587 RepID=A0A7S3LPH8_9STRA
MKGLLRHFRTVTGSDLSSISLKQFKNGMGWGVEAARDLKAGELILKIPKDLWLPTSASQAWDELNSLEPRLCEDLIEFSGKQTDLTIAEKPILVGSVSLVVHILRELGNETSTAKEYLNAIPKTSGKLPIFWNEEQIARLQCSPIIKKVYEQRQFLSTVFSNIIEPHLGGSSLYSAPNFAWGYTLLLSRAISSVKDKVPYGLVPILDFFNHCTPASQAGYCIYEFSHQDEAYYVVPTIDVPKGQQLFLSYGLLGNDDLLRKYGFCFARNPHNIVQVGAVLNSGSPVILECSAQGKIIQRSREGIKLDDEALGIHVQAALDEYPTSLSSDIEELRCLREAESTAMEHNIGMFVCIFTAFVLY